MDVVPIMDLVNIIRGYLFVPNHLGINTIVVEEEKDNDNKVVVIIDERSPSWY